MKWVVFSDIDWPLPGNEIHSCETCNEALSLMQKRSIPLVICSSKTRAEIEKFRKETNNNHPFISENGGAIFIPKGYFEFGFEFDRATDKYQVIELGTHHKTLIEVLNEVKLSGIDITTFTDMSARELAHETGFSEHEASLAKMREYSSLFKVDKRHRNIINNAIMQKGLKCTHDSKFNRISGDNDKGEAVKILTGLFKRLGKTLTLGLGDSKNDFAMLNSVDMPYLIQKNDGSYISTKYNKAGEAGSAGWNKIILSVLKS